jgi:hypothetical protein
MLVARASLRNDGLRRHGRLVSKVARFVYPVRLVGVGGAAQRFDLSLIEQEPEWVVGDVRLRELGALRGTRSYLLVHPAYLEFWRRSGLAFRRVAALPREDLHDVRFIEHDPDGIGATDDHHRGAVGTLEVYVTGRRRLYFLVLVKPDPRTPGPASNPGQD